MKNKTAPIRTGFSETSCFGRYSWCPVGSKDIIADAMFIFVEASPDVEKKRINGRNNKLVMSMESIIPIPSRESIPNELINSNISNDEMSKIFFVFERKYPIPCLVKNMEMRQCL